MGEALRKEEGPDLSYLRKLVFDQSGIVLEKRQDYLLDSRLTPIIRKEGFDSIEALQQHLLITPFNGLHSRVVEAMTTNETFFFRDFSPFETLKKTILPDIIEKRRSERTLRVWSAACSSGQEAYSVAMLIRENFPELNTWKIDIRGSDLSSDVLARAKEAKYNQIEVNRGLPAILLVKYFEKWGVEWMLKEEIRSMVEFFKFNLKETWPILPQFDVIFLRNVMIYFNIDMKKEILSKIKKQLRPDGFLFLGGAETTLNLDEDFQRCSFDQGSCFRIVKG